MNRKHWKKLILAIPLIILFITILVTIPYQQALVLKTPETNELLAYIPLTEDETFKIKYTHSIHLSDVVESYREVDGQIQLEELMYEDFAIGMPSNASAGELFLEEAGKYYLKNMNRVFPHFILRVGQVHANHTIIFAGKDYPLSDHLEPGTRVQIQIEKLNLLRQLKGVNIVDG